MSTSRFGRAVPVNRLLRSAAWVPLRTTRLAATTASALTVLTVETAAAAVTTGTALATTPLRRATALVSSAQVGPSLARVAGELAGGEPSRRCWRADNRYWIEVCGLDDTAVGHRVAAGVLHAVRDQPGVAAAKLNRAISRVIVWVDADGPTPRELCAVIDTAENDARAGAVRSPRKDRTELPADDIVLARGVTTVAVNAAGLGAALVGRALRAPRLPAGLAAVVAVVDYQPRLRGLIEDRLGSPTTDTVLALAAAAAHTVTQAPASLAVDLLLNLAKTAESQAASKAWQRCEPTLSRHAGCAAPAPPRTGPERQPRGPVERHADLCGLTQAVGAPAIGLASRSATAAATAALVTAPKAARSARDVFASTLGRGLANDHGVLVLRPDALRLLDRIDTVLIDPRAICTVEPTLRRHNRVTDHEQAASSSAGTPDGNGQSPPQTGVGYGHHPLAAAVLAEARRAGAEVASVDVASLDDLRSVFDELHPASGSIDTALAEAVDRLQNAGRTVAVLSTAAAQAFSAADVAIGVVPRHGPPPWQAQMLVDDLAGACQILHALPAARRASRRGVEIATAASSLGALLMIPGVRGRGPGPVTAGAAAGLWTGYRLALAALRDTAPPPAPTYAWHAMPVEQVRRILPPPPVPTDNGGPARTLADTKAARAGVEPLHAVREFTAAVRAELSDPLTPVLATGAAASAVLGSPVDAVLVGSVMVGNAVLAAAQRVRAERLLRRMLAVQDPPARRVLEDATGPADYRSVDSACLRPGDVIEVRPGEVVPADARLIEARDLEVDESTLTGESLPVVKQVAATPGAVLAERSCMLYADTTVVAGIGVAVVTAVGDQTQARRAAQVPVGETSAVGLQAQLRELTNRAWPISLAGGALVTGLGLLHRTGLRRAVGSGVAISVAAVPEGLPLVATLAQQASAHRLSRLGALVRSPRAVEALGRVDTVCFDKTGTLSENRLRIAQVRAAHGFSREKVLACAAQATPPANGGHDHTTDIAVRNAAADLPAYQPVGVSFLPFRPGRAYSASVSGTGLSIKGAPEVVLAACGNTDPLQRAVGEMAAAGLRVIAVARRDLTPEQAVLADADPDAFIRLCGEGLQPVGLLGLSDTPRPTAARVLAELTEQNIGVRLITGDHPVTATAIAAELGMPVTADEVIGGAEWDALPRRGQEQAVAQRRVFARMSPEHKRQIVETLQRLGHVCAMVGDGANDAAAIRAATVGIGVATRGSDPARTAADVMLLDGRIEALLDALDEGRQLWRRVQAAVAVLLGGNAGEVAFAIVGSAITGRSPLNARQLLLVNLLTDALPAAALAVSPVNGRIPDSGRGPDRSALWRTVAVRGATTAAATTVAWGFASVTGRPRRASTVALVALVSTQLGQTLLDSRSPLVIATVAGSVITLGAAISTPGLSQLLGSTPLGPIGWSQALGAAALATATAAIAPRVVKALSGPAAPRPSDATLQSSTRITPHARRTTASSPNSAHSQHGARNGAAVHAVNRPGADLHISS